jgi:hypothetical protein
LVSDYFTPKLAIIYFLFLYIYRLIFIFYLISPCPSDHVIILITSVFFSFSLLSFLSAIFLVLFLYKKEFLLFSVCLKEIHYTSHLLLLDSVTIQFVHTFIDLFHPKIMTEIGARQLKTKPLAVIILMFLFDLK